MFLFWGGGSKDGRERVSLRFVLPRSLEEVGFICVKFTARNRRNCYVGEVKKKHITGRVLSATSDIQDSCGVRTAFRPIGSYCHKKKEHAMRVFKIYGELRYSSEIPVHNAPGLAALLHKPICPPTLTISDQK